MSRRHRFSNRARRTSLTPQGASLLARLKQAYPDKQFATVTRASVSEQNNPLCPPLVIAFEHESMCIIDPLTEGFERCDAQAVYGISQADAEAIRAYNNIIGA